MSDTLQKLEELIYKGFQETDRKIRESAAESERMRQESAAEAERTRKESAAEAERMRKESAAEAECMRKESAAEWDRKLQASQEIEEKRRKEAEEKYEKRRHEAEEQAEKRRQELELSIKASDLQIKRTEKMVGDLTGRWGRFAEDMVAPAVIEQFQALNIPIHHYYLRLFSRPAHFEYDIVAVNSDVVIPIEVKTTLEPHDVMRFVEKQLPIFKENFPEHANKKIIGAMGALSFKGNADELAIAQGLYLLRQSGKNIYIANPSEFKPRFF
jgi:hypothetical protein